MQLSETINDPDAVALKAAAVLATVGDEQAVDAHGLGGFEVMDGVAQVEGVVRLHLEIRQVMAGALGLTPCMDVAPAANFTEAIG